MFSRFSSIGFLALPMLAAASVLPRSPFGGQCNTGALNCCDSVHAASSAPVAGPLGLLGIVLGDVTGLVGLHCSPLNIIGVSGSSCSAQPVCCTGNSFNGLVALGCTPVNLNL